MDFPYADVFLIKPIFANTRARARARGIRTTLCPVKGHMMVKKSVIKGLNHQKSIKINEIHEKTMKINEKT